MKKVNTANVPIYQTKLPVIYVDHVRVYSISTCSACSAVGAVVSAIVPVFCMVDRSSL